MPVTVRAEPVEPPEPRARCRLRGPRGFAALGATLLLAVSLAGCAADPRPGVVELRLGHVNSTDDPWQETSEQFADLVEQRSGGSVRVEVFPGGQLGADRDMVEGMRLGTVDAALVAGVLSSVEPSMTLLEVPYLFDSMDEMERALEGPGGDRLSGALLDAGVRNLAWLNRGPRELTADRPITTPEEVGNAKIRVPEISASIDGWQAMGANPTPMAFSEVYGALQQGVIDGQENPLSIVDSAGLADVQSHVMLTDHVYGYVMLALSEQAWAELDPGQQQVVTAAAEEVRIDHNARTRAQEGVYRQALVEAGATFVDVDRAAFERAARPIQQEYAERYGRDLYDQLVGTDG